jgi:hypothetical protein
MKFAASRDHAAWYRRHSIPCLGIKWPDLVASHPARPLMTLPGSHPGRPAGPVSRVLLLASLWPAGRATIYTFTTFEPGTRIALSGVDP